ncbi:hypothetical protein SBA3_3000016 [Candidatus Sulfopaludibacter sp. SbA3]|nr:hypothetical protein SBA3_3000016 [Candidatus Sulfopaludibacter sp. SbA3]
MKAGSEEQARGIESVAKAVARMEQMTQQTAAGAKESQSASEALSAQSKGLWAAVDQLEMMVGADR